MPALTWCTASDINAVWDADLTQFGAGVVDYHIGVASYKIESYLRARFVLPATPNEIPADLRNVAATIAMWGLVCYQGYQPTQSDADTSYKARYDDAIAILVDLQTNGVHPDLAPLESNPPVRYAVSANAIYTTAGGVSGSGYRGTTVGAGGIVGAGRNPLRGW